MCPGASGAAHLRILTQRSIPRPGSLLLSTSIMRRFWPPVKRFDTRGCEVSVTDEVRALLLCWSWRVSNLVRFRLSAIVAYHRQSAHTKLSDRMLSASFSHAAQDEKISIGVDAPFRCSPRPRAFPSCPSSRPPTTGRRCGKPGLHPPSSVERYGHVYCRHQHETDSSSLLLEFIA
jgi:hypothetical protein